MFLGHILQSLLTMHHTTFYFCLLVFCLFVNAVGTEFVRLCHASHIRKQYAIATPQQCRREPAAAIRNCSVIVHSPADRTFPVFAYRCSILITKWSTTKFFFGAETSKQTTVPGSPPSPTLCWDWVKHHNTEYGLLNPLSRNSWSTSNKVQLKFTWPTETCGEVHNVLILKFRLVYDMLTDKLSSPINDVTSCNIRFGSCHSGSETIVWTIPNKYHCPFAKPKLPSQVLLHFNHSGSLYRAELSGYGVSLHDHIQCSSKISLCFRNEILCLNNGLVLEMPNCTVLRNLTFNSNVKYSNHYQPSFHKFLAARAVATENEDLVSEALERLSIDLNFLECNLQNLLTTLFHIVGKQYPGEVLSNLLHTDVAGLTSGDLLSELVCETVNATILPDMFYNGSFTRRPIVRYTSVSGDTLIGQVFRDGNIYKYVRLFEPFTPGQEATFRIGNKFYLFQNYSLVRIRHDINFLQPSLSPIKNTFHTTDFDNLGNLFPSQSTGFEDMTSVLQLVSEATSIKQQFSRMVDSSNLVHEQSDVHYVSDTIRNTVNNIFIQFLTSITSPILSIIFLTTFFLSLIWGVIWTLIFLKFILPRVFSKVFRSTNEAQRTTE